MGHGRKMAVYSSYFSAGATFEVFSPTLAITGLLLEKARALQRKSPLSGPLPSGV
jgi:hypothetical protein